MSLRLQDPGAAAPADRRWNADRIAYGRLMGKHAYVRLLSAAVAVIVVGAVLGSAPGNAATPVRSAPSATRTPTTSVPQPPNLDRRTPDIASLYADTPMNKAHRTSGVVARSVDVTARAGSQCAGSGFEASPTDAVQARNIMAGRFKLDRYGYMDVASNPNWHNQGSLDYSGNGLQHALWWALPLLRTGMADNRPDMTARFYALIDDWLHDNPIKRPRSSQAYGQIESGFRMITLACAAQYAGSRTRRYTRALREQARYAVSRWTLVNNASFHQASGIFTAACLLPDRKLRRRALSYLARAAGSLIHSDGSVFEGSLEYARATYIWTLEEANRVQACGVAPPAELARAYLIPNFLAYGVRPDGKYEALGDGGAKTAYPADAPPGTYLQYASTAGESGPTPPSLFAPFGAGFVFGRSGWGTGDSFAGKTFYSVRTGAGPSQVYHAHADAGSLTVHADGAQLLLDSGPYGGSSTIRTRLAHNVVSIDGLAPRSPAPTVVTARSNADGDLITLADRSYRKTSLTRTIWYDRQGDFFVVIDTIKQQRRRTVSQNWNLGRDRAVELVGSSAHTTGAGANLSLISVGTAPGYSVLQGSYSPWGGWNSEFYSEVAPAPSVRAAMRDKRLTFATVIIPRAIGVGPESVAASGETYPGGANVTVTRGGTNYGLRITGSDAVRF